MAELSSKSTANSPINSRSTATQTDPDVAIIDTVPEIPIEIVSDEEMAIIEAALAATHSLVPSSIRSPSRSSLFGAAPYLFQRNARSIHSTTLLSKKRFSDGTDLDIEDSGDLRSTQKKNRVKESYLQRFRSKRALAVTDFTGAEWCEKQMEFVLSGKRKVNRAMKAGQARHLVLEEEVIRKIKVRVESAEDNMAVKLLSSITGVNQLLFDGLTRELPLLGFVKGTWMVGVIDEVRMPLEEGSCRSPILVDTKTRHRDTLPAEPQRRNGKLQLMLYKLLWDTLITDEFPSKKFFDYFALNRYGILSPDIRDNIASAGFPAQTLEDVVEYYRNTCKTLPLTQNQLLLRYEFQKDQSLLAEVRFDYDLDWVKNQIGKCLEFWRGEREPSFAPEEERWKCQYCQFASSCPGNANPDVVTSSSSPRKSNPCDSTRESNPNPDVVTSSSSPRKSNPNPDVIDDSLG